MANKNNTPIELKETVDTLNHEPLVNTLNQEPTIQTQKTTNPIEVKDVSIWQSKNKVAPHFHTMIMVSKGWKKGKEVTEQEYMSSLTSLRSVNNGK